MLADVKRELESGTSPEVKKLAEEAEPIVEEHLNLLLQVEEPPSPVPSES